MNNKPLISVIVPIYTTEKYLRKCFDSIINQTYKNLQIILVDDGSTDNSGKICDEYATKDSRIQVIHKQNAGVTAARNEGLDIADGEYIGFVDSDDWIEPNMYEEMFENLITTDADIVHTGFIREQYGLSKKEFRFDECVIENPKNSNYIWKGLLFLQKDFFITPFLFTKLFKCDLIKYALKNVPKGMNFGEDRISTTECFLKSNRVSLLKNAYYHYNLLREGSYTSTISAQRIIWITKMFEQVRNLFYKYNIYDQVKNYWELSINRYMLMQLSRANIIITNLFGHIDELNGKKVIIYGAGKVGYNYYTQISKTSNCDIVDWVDKNFANYDYNERKVNPINNIKSADYDIIIIAVKYKNTADQIINELLEMGIEKNKLCWHEPIESSYISVE